MYQDEIRDNLINLCEQFISLADKLLQDKKITQEQYIAITHYKIEFLKNYVKKLETN